MVTASLLVPSNFPYRFLFSFPAPFQPSIGVSIGRVSKENMEISQLHLINLFIISQRTDATEIVKGQWPLRSFYAFFSSASLPWEVLPTVLTTVIVPIVSPVVQIKSVERDVTTVCTTTSVERTSNAVMGNVSAVSLHVRVRTTTNVTLANSAVKANASVALLPVPARTTTNVDRARNAVKANVSIVYPLVSVRMTTNVNRARNVVIASALTVRHLATVRPTTSVTLMRIVVGEFVPHTVVGAAGLLQALLSARLFFLQSSFPSYPAAAALVARTTAIVHQVLWSSPANSHSNKSSQSK